MFFRASNIRAPHRTRDVQRGFFLIPIRPTKAAAFRLTETSEGEQRYHITDIFVVFESLQLFVLLNPFNHVLTIADACRCGLLPA